MSLALAATAIWIVVWLSLVHRSHPVWIHVAFLSMGPLLGIAVFAVWRALSSWFGQAESGRRFVLVPIALVCLMMNELAVFALGDEARWTCLPVFAAASAAGLLIGELRDASTRGVRVWSLVVTIGYAIFAATLVQTLLQPLDLSRSIHSADATTPAQVARIDDLLQTGSGVPPRSLLYGSPNGVPARAAPTTDSLMSRAIDARALLADWNGFTGWLRSGYFGFGPEALPLAGRIWLPDAEIAGPHPLILVAHGNHPMEEPSYEGFGYLCDALARQGSICVSTDMRFLNTSYLGDLFGGLEGDRLVRSWMLLEHLDLIRTWNGTPGNPLHGRVDLDEIGLVGHSRGGAVVVMAADLNGRSEIPGRRGATLPAGFRIRSVTALAPVELQPSDRRDDGRPSLSGTSYLVLHGSQDTDIHSFEGSLQYGRMDPRSGDDTLQASFHFAGGNHAQFNTEWGDNDKPLLLAPLIDQSAVMDARDQRALTLAVLTRFLDAVNGQSDADREWLRGPRDLALRHGGVRVAHRYRDARSIELAGFDEDEDPSTATIAGGAVAAANFEFVREEHIERRWRGSAEISRSLRLVWNADPVREAPRLTLSLPDRAVSLAADDLLLIDLALDVHAADVPDSVALVVELADDRGRRARSSLAGGIGALSSGRAPLYNARILNPRAEILPTTHSLRVGDFESIDPGFDPSRLRALVLVFDPARGGTLLIDGIAARSAI